MTPIEALRTGPGGGRTPGSRRLPAVALLSLGAVTSLGGCMVGPDYVRPAMTMPETYRERGPGQVPAMESAADAAAEETRWWRRFEDPRLTSLVEEAVRANNGVAVAEARLREARAGRRMVQSLLYPRVGVGASVLGFRASQAALDVPEGMLDLDDHLFQVGFDASWVLDVFGGVRRGVESAEAGEQAVDALRRGVVLMVASDTARAYLELRGVQHQLEVARRTLEEQRQTLAITEDKRRNGLASDLEVARARTEVESTAAEIPPLQQAGRQYIHVLSTLLGLEPTALASELEAPMPLPGPPSRLAVGIPSDLLRRRPDVQAAERLLASATAGVGVATAELFPKVVLGVGAGLASRDAGDLFNGDGTGNPSDYHVAGPVINWTLFDGGRRRSGIEIAEARVEAAKASYQDTVLRAFREVESALVAVDRARARLADLERLSASARECTDIARGDYRRGILDQLTVLDAQRQSNRADMLLTQGRVALSVHTVSLYKALGGGWEVAERVPAAGPDGEVLGKGRNP
ncbi:MAG: efflux transporter outer membrane subunit [Planctomycetes bacterium]|nr:efflux transporter outer membrane subunit [Planctomycetota bacterium]